MEILITDRADKVGRLDLQKATIISVIGSQGSDWADKNIFRQVNTRSKRAKCGVAEIRPPPGAPEKPSPGSNTRWYLGRSYVRAIVTERIH